MIIQLEFMGDCNSDCPNAKIPSKARVGDHIRLQRVNLNFVLAINASFITI